MSFEQFPTHRLNISSSQVLLYPESGGWQSRSSLIWPQFQTSEFQFWNSLASLSPVYASLYNCIIINYYKKIHILIAASNAGLWHKLGGLQCHWSYEFYQVYSQGMSEPFETNRQRIVAPFDMCDLIWCLFVCLQRIGYLAASQSFHDDTEVLMLTTNMIRKVTAMLITKIHFVFRINLKHNPNLLIITNFKTPVISRVGVLLCHIK